MDADQRYLACFVSTRSEIVVPIVFAGQVVGEIDIDSDEPGRLRGTTTRRFSSTSPGWSRRGAANVTRVAPDADSYRGALEAVDRVLNREPEADEVLRQVVAVLADRLEPYDWVGISFAEGGAHVLGPWTGARVDGAPTHDEAVVYDGAQRRNAHRDRARGVRPSQTRTRAFLKRVALLVSLHCLVGWDTGGVPWPEVGSGSARARTPRSLAAGCGGQNGARARTRSADEIGRADRESDRRGRRVGQCARPTSKRRPARRSPARSTGTDGTSVTIDVEQTSDEGALPFQAPILPTTETEQIIAKDIGDGSAVDCPELVLAKAGKTFTARCGGSAEWRAYG